MITLQKKKILKNFLLSQKKSWYFSTKFGFFQKSSFQSDYCEAYCSCHREYHRLHIRFNSFLCVECLQIKLSSEKWRKTVGFYVISSWTETRYSKLYELWCTNLHNSSYSWQTSISYSFWFILLGVNNPDSWIFLGWIII